MGEEIPLSYQRPVGSVARALRNELGVIGNPLFLAGMVSKGLGQMVEPRNGGEIHQVSKV